MLMRREKNKNLTARQLAMLIKSKANELVQDLSYPLTNLEYKTLIDLTMYMDIFVIHCIDKRDRIKNYMWITARLLETSIFLGVSTRKEIKTILDLVGDLDDCIMRGIR